MANNPVIFNAFTVKWDKIVGRLITNVSALNGNSATIKPALWDTGASCTSISHDVVNELGLIPTGKMHIRTPSGESEVNTYLIDVQLPNDVTITGVRVCESDIGKQQIGLLIGMDIISLGDMAVSNFDNKTVFSFRHPSKKSTDYVNEINIENKIGQKHGKGNKKHNYKKQK